MELVKIIELQKKFDGEHKGRFNWDQSIDGENVQILEYLLIGLMGEVGELANIVKKIDRGDLNFENCQESISEELIDIFIYVLKLGVPV